MPQKVSTAPEPPANQTLSVIQQYSHPDQDAPLQLHPRYLNDEDLQEAERVEVLEEVFHRNIRSQELELLARYIAPLLGGRFPANLFIFGVTGTGKSVTCLHFLSTLARMAPERGVPFRYVYVDMTTPRTCFGAFNELALALHGTTRRYLKGVALAEMQEKIIAALRDLEGFVCILIDEADNITQHSDIFYLFLAKTLPRLVRPHLFYIFLSNRLGWERNLNPRVLSVLKRMNLAFKPYDAEDLVKILELRVEKALNPARVEPAAIHKIAALASRETGDARKAVELLAKAVKVAEDGSGILSEAVVDAAYVALEEDKTEEVIRGKLAPHQRLALLACYTGMGERGGRVSTGEAFRYYVERCGREQTSPLSYRRFSDILNALALNGLVNARLVWKGRLGVTREISSQLPENVARKLLTGGG